MDFQRQKDAFYNINLNPILSAIREFTQNQCIYAVNNLKQTSDTMRNNSYTDLGYSNSIVGLNSQQGINTYNEIKQLMDGDELMTLTKSVYDLTVLKLADNNRTTITNIINSKKWIGDVPVLIDSSLFVQDGFVMDISLFADVIEGETNFPAWYNTAVSLSYDVLGVTPSGVDDPEAYGTFEQIDTEMEVLTYDILYGNTSGENYIIIGDGGEIEAPR